MCDELRSENKTLVISCDLHDANDGLTVKLHFRYVNKQLYCFVEEADE